MDLYFHPLSANCRKVIATAHTLNIKLALKPVDLSAGENRTSKFLALNPMGRVPILVDEDLVLWESNAIMQYLAELRPDWGLWPSDVATRAEVNRWLCWGLAHWDPALSALIADNYFTPLRHGGVPDTARIEQAAAEFQRLAQILDAHLCRREFLVGDMPSLADFAVAAYLGDWQVAGIPLPDHPYVYAWYRRVDALEAWHAAAPHVVQQVTRRVGYNSCPV